MYTTIIQQAVQTHNLEILVSLNKDTIIYIDEESQTHTLSGGIDYLKLSTNFPGKGCESLVVLDSDPDWLKNDRLIVDFKGKFQRIKDLGLEELIQASSLPSLHPAVKQTINYWIKQKQEIHGI